MRLLPDRRMVRLIMELTGNRSFTLYHRQRQTEQVTTPPEQRPTGIRPVTPSQHLHL